MTEIIHHEPVRIPVLAHVRLTVPKPEQPLETPRQRRRRIGLLWFQCLMMAVMVAVVAWQMVIPQSA